MDTMVKDENGNIYRIKGKLGSGGQGCVFSVLDNDSVVIKALVNDDEKLDIVQDEKKYASYQYNVRRIMAVGEFSNVAVPYAMLEKPYCGYVMIFMNGLQSIDKLMIPFVYKDNKTKQICISDFKNATKCFQKLTEEEYYFGYNFNGTLVKRLKCLAKLAKILGEFEDKDVVYCDLSPNNVYISKDPKSYEAWLIDLDNLSHSQDVKSPIGTPKFMAPEVVKGQPNTIFSDRYSFALIAYQFLMVKDPFLGQAQDDFDSWDSDGSDEDEFETAVANGEIPWIWEKNDTSNRSTSGLNPYDFLNEELIDLFERTFNLDGRRNPTHRPSMWEWYDALTKASESSFIGTIKFEGPSFASLIKKDNKIKYYYQEVGFISKVEPFQKETKIQRLKVNIKNVVELSDEEGNTEYIALDDKVIYWDQNKNKYCLSNFDVYRTRPHDYVKDFIVLSKEEELFGRSKKFNVSCYSKDYEVVIIEDNCVVKSIEKLLETIIYVKYKGKTIKKITIEKE